MNLHNTTKPLVSVITPVYNGIEHIAACIQSVAHSRTNNRIDIEHIIIDDGSADQTLMAIEAAIAELAYPEMYTYRLLRLPHSGKPASVRNHGIAEAKGHYIFCLDHDDILLQNTLRYMVEHLETTGREMAYGDFLRSDDRLAYDIGNDYCGIAFTDTHAALYSLFKGDHFFQHSFMFTKRLWQQLGGYDDAITYGEDFDLCVRSILAGHMTEHVPITTHIHRNHSKSLTACYGHRCAVWLEEHQAHYRKFRKQLPRYLAPQELSEIEEVLQITPHMQPNEPLSKERASTLTAIRKATELTMVGV
ncbi:MAG: glycosyltransferase [Methylococcales bacterium]